MNDDETKHDDDQWFGESWGAPMCTEATHIATPVGERCPSCREPIREGDVGLSLHYHAEDDPSETMRLAFHLVCYARSIGVTPKGSA